MGTEKVCISLCLYFGEDKLYEEASHLKEEERPKSFMIMKCSEYTSYCHLYDSDFFIFIPHHVQTVNCPARFALLHRHMDNYWLLMPYPTSGEMPMREENQPALVEIFSNAQSMLSSGYLSGNKQEQNRHSWTRWSYRKIESINGTRHAAILGNVSQESEPRKAIGTVAN